MEVMEVETTDVVICGCGPTGAMLSALLAKYGVPNIVLEKESDITTDPRGIGLDEDGIRSLQGIGIYDDIFTKIGCCIGALNFIGGRHSDLTAKPFLRMDYSTTEGGTGHIGVMSHKQPVLESSIRSCLENSCSVLRQNSEVCSIDEDEEWVYVEYYVGSNTAKRKIRSKFLVGADGKTGFTRKNYLEPHGVLMETVSKTTYEETWVALNWKLTIPTPVSHPEFPLWKLGYTPDEVYDLFFPTEFRFLCNPDRPAVCGRFGLPSDRLWRFEFVVQDGEDPNEMAEMHKIIQVVHPYITHPGSRYNLSEDIQYPLDCIEVLRSRPFKFSARSCNIWARQRVMLCGDAAHVFPPFGGQGITSGFRDAYALAWRLALITRSDFRHPFDPIIRGWYLERKQQLEKSLAATIENGRLVTETNALKIILRDTILRIVQFVPSWRHWLEKGARRGGMLRYQHFPEAAFIPESGGYLFPQVYCARIGLDSTPKIKFTDDVIFHGKKKLFQMVVLLQDLAQLKESSEALSGIDELSEGEITSDEVTYLLQDCDARKGSSLDLGRDVYRLANSEEFAADQTLCGLRPPPVYYDPQLIMKETRGMRYIILRQDRFVFASCNTIAELEHVVDALRQLTGIDQG